MRLPLFRLLIPAVLALLMSCNQPDDKPDPSIETDLPAVKTDVPAVEDTSDDGGLEVDGEAEDVGADSTPDMFGEGGFGWPCESGDDCQAPLCLAGPDGMECSFPCAVEDDCPQGYKCLFLSGEGMVCQSLFTNLCRPCLSDEECGALALCRGDEVNGHYCGGDCGDGYCPAGFICSEVAVNTTNEPEDKTLATSAKTSCSLLK